MIVRVFIIFLGARMLSATSTSPTGEQPLLIERKNGEIQDESNPGMNNQHRGRILTTSKHDSVARDAEEKQQTVMCDRWYLTIDGRVQCLPAGSTFGISTDDGAPQTPQMPLHLYVPGLPSFGMPIWSSSPIDQTPSPPLSYGNLHFNEEVNDRNPTHGHEETVELKPVILKPVQLVPKPIVVHKPVLVPKPIEIPIHKPVLVHKPIEIIAPPVIHKPVEIPIHKPVFVHKPLEITVHKPVIVHKPIKPHGLNPTEHHHESLLSQLLKQYLAQLRVPQQIPQDIQGVNHNINTHKMEKPMYGELHQTGFVMSHESLKDASEDNVFQNRFPVALHPDMSPPSPVLEFHNDVKATAKISPVGHSGADVKTSTDQVIEGVIKTLSNENDELPKSIYSKGNEEDLKQLGTSPVNVSSPSQRTKNALNSTIPATMGLHGSQSPLEDFNGNGTGDVEKDETSPSPPKHFEDERNNYPTRSPVEASEMASEAKFVESEMDSEAGLGQGPDAMEDAQNEEDEELSRTIREVPAVPFDDILRDKQRAGTILDRTTLLEIMTALKDQYLRNTEPDQRKVIEDAFDRLYSSVRNMKQLDERPNWKKTDGSKKATLELLTERAPIDVDEWDYYSDAADDVSAEPSFLELLNVATKHKGKQAEVNRLYLLP